MLPPRFVRRVEAEGVNAPCCYRCVHAALFQRQEVCMEYGVYVLLRSSCGSFERRAGLDNPVATADDIREEFAAGLVDMRDGQAAVTVK